MTGGSGEHGKSHREIITRGRNVGKEHVSAVFAASWSQADHHSNSNQMELMRTHNPVAILHVAAIRSVCHILER
jgi:hypothetical protein